MRVEVIGEIKARRRDIMCATVRALAVRFPSMTGFAGVRGVRVIACSKQGRPSARPKCSHNHMKPRRNPSARKLRERRTYGCLCAGQSGLSMASEISTILANESATVLARVRDKFN